ncbi:hypothetical protein KPL78_27015 [Roseomonas sp. HJA6]|uniref:Uncharacterized protein n=1 Tax=Roseomonas alba TaxID=2846776 RepID=A0ABS7AGT5_9PROT|nr:hypothetical protein [Neoroseomonas alba]MBW6401532.1 hypothetical protein [Neoroseomonas alba]
MARVLLALAAGPGFPEGSPEHRYEIELMLDAAGRPDGRAWAADPTPWRAQRIVPDAPPTQGDVQHDPDHGWTIRFYGATPESPDAPESSLEFGAEPVRPGEYVTVTEPDGQAYAYRVVGIT